MFETRTTDADFQARWHAFLNEERATTDPNVEARVRDIIKDVQARGDSALLDLTARFDRFEATMDALRISEDELAAACETIDPDVRASLETAADRIRAFHSRQTVETLRYTDDTGTELGQFWTAMDAVGLYVPGGLATYPSSVLMNAVPAKVAGVERLVITVPTPDGVINPVVLAAAHIAGVTEVWRIGGAQAVAALAYGTQTLAPVNKIVGPGNAYVAEAKRQVFGRVGIDTIAGPSEILVIAEEGSNPPWVAADLLSQAEHDSVAQSVLLTPSATLAEAVKGEIDRQLSALPKADIARASWHDYGAVVVTSSLEEAVDLSNQYAPEHLELMVKDPDTLLSGIKHAGAVFMGAYTPEAIGDYVAGPNHVLPTSHAARFSSGLSVYDFLKRTTIARCTPESLSVIGPAAVTLGHAEGLQAHAQSVSIRLKDITNGS